MLGAGATRSDRQMPSRQFPRAFATQYKGLLERSDLHRGDDGLFRLQAPLAYQFGLGSSSADSRHRSGSERLGLNDKFQNSTLFANYDVPQNRELADLKIMKHR